MFEPEILWAPPPGQRQLDGREIHVWAASLMVSGQKLMDLSRLLSGDERRRANTFQFESGRNAFVCSRGWLRIILASYLSIQPENVQFEYASRGKPFLAGQIESERLHFNLAHSGPLLLTAVTRICPLGVDVEHIRPLENIDDLAKQLLNAREEGGWRKLPHERQHRAFFNLWTRKEACLKATGEGIAERLREITVSFRPGEPSGALEPPLISGSHTFWTLIDLHPAEEFAAALAVPDRDFRLSCWRWPV